MYFACSCPKRQVKIGVNKKFVPISREKGTNGSLNHYEYTMKDNSSFILKSILFLSLTQKETNQLDCHQGGRED